MRAASTQLRRLVASLMLVAMATFGLHNGSVAGLHQHGPAKTECGAGHRHTHAPETGAPAGHVHKAGHHHHHIPSAEQPDGPGEPTSAGFDSSCCTGACPVAVTAAGPGAMPFPVAAVLRQLPEAQTGAAATLEGLKRPPRTLGIA